MIDTRYSLLQPVVEDDRKVLVGKSLVDPFGKAILVRLVNMEDHPVQLRKNYLIGELHAVTALLKFNNLTKNAYRQILSPTQSMTMKNTMLMFAKYIILNGIIHK